MKAEKSKCPVSPFCPFINLLCDLNYLPILFSFFSALCGVWHGLAVRVLVPQPCIEPVPPAVDVQGLNLWAAREVHVHPFLKH